MNAERSIRRNSAAQHPKSEIVEIASITLPDRRIRSHSKAKLQRLSKSLSALGQIEPVVVNAAMVLVHGSARLTAAQELGWRDISVIRVEHLSDAELRAFAVSANKFAMDAEFDLGELRLELEELEAIPDLDLELTGFSTPEIDTLHGAHHAKVMNDLEDDLPILPSEGSAISARGELWHLGRHRLLCGDATSSDDLDRLMDGAIADQLFVDPPYNVKIDGHVTGNGKVKHREFAMGVGEMAPAEFVSFLATSLGAAAEHLVDGALAYVCMDHAHIGELIEAGSSVFHERKAICVWDKGSGGMGSLYRNAHELVAVFKKGTARHTNNIELGRHGRNRTTIWRYPGIACQGNGRAKALSLHPTVKPVALVADAILDASPRAGVILDSFGASGTTLVAAERTGRHARLLELDPSYVDVIIRRFEAFTGEAAIRDDGATFEEVRIERSMEPEAVAS